MITVVSVPCTINCYNQMPCYKATLHSLHSRPKELQLYNHGVLPIPSSYVSTCVDLGNLNKLLSIKWVVIQNADCAIEVITGCFHSFGDTFSTNDPLFTSMNYVITCNPHNIEYIFKTNFSNFPKGCDFVDMVDIFGDGLFRTDSYLELWKNQRKILHTELCSKEFRSYIAEVSKQELEFALIPLLMHFTKETLVVDLQDLFLRLAYDNTFTMVFGENPKLLSLGFPVNEFSEAIDVAMETIVYRHCVPRTCWKLLRWFKIGWERRYSKAFRTIDCILENMILVNKKKVVEGVAENSLLSTYMKSQLQALGGYDQDENAKHLRDFVFTVIFASGDTTASGLTWFFWLLSQNPMVEAKILDELNQLVRREKNTNMTETNKMKVFHQDELKDLLYLQAALYESLRLYPPVHMNHRAATKADVLPDGTRLEPSTKVIMSTYAAGRTKSIWGEDCLDFRPERWITEDGSLRTELLSKYFAFSVGPRNCIGRDIGFNSMKLVAANVIFNFDIQVVECKPDSLKQSMVLFMKNGLKVKISEKIAH